MPMEKKSYNWVASSLQDRRRWRPFPVPSCLRTDLWRWGTHCGPAPQWRAGKQSARGWSESGSLLARALRWSRRPRRGGSRSPPVWEDGACQTLMPHAGVDDGDALPLSSGLPFLPYMNQSPNCQSSQGYWIVVDCTLSTSLQLASLNISLDSKILEFAFRQKPRFNHMGSCLETLLVLWGLQIKGSFIWKGFKVISPPFTTQLLFMYFIGH